MKVVSLASGSSGNAYLVCAGDVRVTMDCGLSARRLAHEMIDLGLHPTQLQAIFLSHEHSDHIKSVSTLSNRYGIPVIANEGTLRGLGPLAPKTAQLMPTGSTVRLGELCVTSFPLPHDGNETIGYFLQRGERSVCLATDLGHAPEHLIEYLRAADLMILEANHDIDLLVNGPYPWYLKRRILGPRGHLSNVDSASTVIRATTGLPQSLWLAHLSQTNNRPALALKTVVERLRQECVSSISVDVALRDTRSLVWENDLSLK